MLKFYSATLVLLFLSVGVMAQITTPVFNQTTPYAVYQKVEVSFNIQNAAASLNPYNPEEATVDANITLPNGTTVTVPCFYYIPTTFLAPVSGYANTVESPANAKWLLRYAPTASGFYRIVLSATYNNSLGRKTTATVSSGFTVNATLNNLGFIRLDRTNNKHLRFDTEQPYYPVGTNAAWNDQTLVQYYSNLFNNLNPTRGGTNWTRYWLTDFARQGLEWSAGHWSGWYQGLGKYSQSAAALLDNVLDICQTKGIYMQLVLQHHGQLSTTANAEWNWNGQSTSSGGNYGNPYRLGNAGGTLTSPEQFFTSDVARAQTRKLYRYIIARWGYSPNILAWELFNEVNLTTNANTAGYGGWHNDMATYIKGLDVNKHLITSSIDQNGGTTALLAIANNASIDMVQPHYFDSQLDTKLLSYAKSMQATTEKAVMMGEFGSGAGTYGYSAPYVHPDNAGDHVRKSMWIGMMNRLPAQFWFWKEYIMPKSLYSIFTPLSNFMNNSSIDVVNDGLQVATPTQLNLTNNTITGTPVSPNFPITAIATNDFYVSSVPQPWASNINPTGSVNNAAYMPRYLHGSNEATLNRSASFTASFAANSTFSFTIKGFGLGSGQSARLTVSCTQNGATTTIGTITNQTGTFTYNSSQLGTTTGIKTITLTSDQQQWFEISNYAFTNITGLQSYTYPTQKPGFYVTSPNAWTGTIDASGNCTNLSTLYNYLHGTNEPTLLRNVAFTGNFEAGATVSMGITGIGVGTSQVAELTYTVMQGSTTLISQVITNPSGTLTFNIPGATGTKTIKISSTKQQWIDIAGYTFTGLGGATRCVLHAMAGTNKSMGYIYDASYGEWATTTPTDVSNLILAGKLSPNKLFYIKYTNPKTGSDIAPTITNPFPTSFTTNATGNFTTTVPIFNKDVAFKIATTTPIYLAVLNDTTKVQKAGKGNLLVYPSLVQTQLTTELNTDETIQSVQIVDMSGRVVMDNKAFFTEGGTIRTIDVSTYPKGMYLMVVTTDKEKLVQRFVKQ